MAERRCAATRDHRSMPATQAVQPGQRWPNRILPVLLAAGCGSQRPQYQCVPGKPGLSGVELAGDLLIEGGCLFSLRLLPLVRVECLFDAVFRAACDMRAIRHRHQ